MSTVHEPRFVASPKEKRRIQNRGVDHVSGLYPSAKPEGVHRILRYDGILMRNLFCLLENRLDVASYEPKPFSFRYFFDGRWRTFTPHVVVVLGSGWQVAHHVTWSSFAEGMRCARRRSAIEEGLRRRDVGELVLTTEEDVMRRPRIDNEALIASTRFRSSDDEIRHLLRLSFAEMGSRATVRELRRAVLHASSYREIVRLVADGEWAVENLDAPFDDRAVIVGREV